MNGRLSHFALRPSAWLLLESDILSYINSQNVQFQEKQNPSFMCPKQWKQRTCRIGRPSHVNKASEGQPPQPRDGRAVMSPYGLAYRAISKFL